MSDTKSTVAVVGLGYFSQFHLTAWSALEDADLVAVCDMDGEKVSTTAAEYGAAGFTGAAAMIAGIEPDIVDIVAPPPAHAPLIRAALAEGRTIICQKPFCTSIEEAREVITEADAAGTRIVVHENFRFQPWYRTIRDLIDEGTLGQIYQARFTLRPGDGRGPEAYLSRQPAFQKMPRLLIHETAVHWIDTFRWLFGPIESVYADLRKLNPVLAGEDDGILILGHAGGVRTVFDGNRLSDNTASEPRRTMGVLTVDCEAGELTLDGEGQIWLRRFGEKTAEDIPVTYPVDTSTFGGGCVAAVIAHVIEARAGTRPFENEARDYLRVMEASEAAYVSAKEGRRVTVSGPA